MFTSNLKPMFVIDLEVLSDLQERSSYFERKEKRGVRWYNFEISGVHLSAFEQGAGTGRYTVTENDNGAFKLIEANADIILRHIDRGFPRVSGDFPSVTVNTGKAPATTANDDKPCQLSGDAEIDAMLADLD